MRNSLLFLFLIAASRPVTAATIWVAPNGRDDGNGSEAQPYATLARARDAIRDAGSQLPREAVTVRLQPGIYELSAPLELTPDDVGSGERSVTFLAEAGSRTVITGSRQLRGTWHRVHADLWRLIVPEAAGSKWVFRSLFRSGESLQRAHEPNQGYYTVTSVDTARRQVGLQPKLPEAWSGLTGVELNSVAHWHYNRQPVASIEGSTVVARSPIGSDASSARLTVKAHNRVWLENALVFADTPGEWFLDTEKGELFYYGRPGEDPNGVRFTAPTASELFLVRGTAQRPVRNLAFRHLEFAETDWEMPADGRPGLQAGAWASDRNRTYSPTAAVRLIFAVNTTFEKCAFRDLGEGAVAFEAGCSDGVVTRSSFRRVGANVIQVGRMPAYTGIGHPLHRDFATSRDRFSEQAAIPGAGELYQQLIAAAPEAPSRFRISDNTIEDCLHLDLGSVGIWVGYASHVRIEHNLLRNLPYTGINVGWRWAPGLTNCHSNIIAHNRVEGVMRHAGDGAGIYLVGEQPGTRVLNNHVHDSRGSYSERGIYIDEFGDHMEIAGNYVTAISDRSIYLHKNGPSQSLHDNNGDSGPTLISDSDNRGRRWIKYTDERTPLQPERYGPRRSTP